MPQVFATTDINYFNKLWKKLLLPLHLMEWSQELCQITDNAFRDGHIVGLLTCSGYDPDQHILFALVP